MKIVKVLKPFACHACGDIAAFEDEVADMLVERCQAEIHAPEVAEEAGAKPAAKKAESK